MKKIFIIILILFLYSCASHDLKDVRMLKTGMSTKELKYYMGEPWQVEVDSDEEDWYFMYMSGDYKKYLVVTIVNRKIKSYYSY
jgi:outer membrane protein assembly factor BamE (lipoprotein component of BamABCDE complex)